MMSVQTETAKQLDFEMKFMGLAVVFMVLSILNPATSAPAPIIAFAPAAATATAVGAALGNKVVLLSTLPLASLATAKALAATAVAGAIPAGFVTGTLLPGKIVAAKGLTLIGVGLAGRAVLGGSQAAPASDEAAPAPAS